jgi:predicted metalloprotease
MQFVTVVVYQRRTRHNEVVTVGSENSDQGSRRPGMPSWSPAERSAWEALKKFVDPPMGSFGPLSNVPADAHAEVAPQVGASGVQPLQTVTSQTERTVDTTHATQSTRSTHATDTTHVTETTQTTQIVHNAHGGLPVEPSLAGAPLPVKPVWPEYFPSTDSQRRKRRRWPILGLVAVLGAGAVVVLAKPSLLPVSLRKTLHVGSSTDRNEAVKGTKDANDSVPDASTSTAPTARPKRAPQAYDPTMRLALTSIDRFWAKQFPELYDETYEKLSGGVYAYSSGSRIPTCDGQSLPYLVLQQNAFYCPESDFIAWDDQGLFPRLEKKYGRFLLAIVLAHEWGHAIQERSGSYLDTITAEQQADCFAGAWAASLDSKTDRELAKLRDTELDKALSGFIEFRDLVGMVPTDPGAHGTAFDRIRAFQDGYEGTPSSCAYYEEELPDLVAIPYRSFKERFRGGNLPYPEVLPSITKELANNWKSVFSTAPVTTSAAKVFPVCFAQPVSPEGFSDSTLSYCDDDKTLRYDEKAMRTLYDGIGDFGPATTIGLGWAMSDLVAQGEDPTTKSFWNEANCRVGAWAGTMFDSDDPENSQLSPGDLDESVRTILESSAKGSSKTYGTGFEQVSAFRAGVLNGVSGCKFLTPTT